MRILNGFSDVKAILNDEELYNEAASEAFPLYNKSQMICLEMPGRIGDVSRRILMETFLFNHGMHYLFVFSWYRNALGNRNFKSCKLKFLIVRMDLPDEFSQNGYHIFHFASSQTPISVFN